MHKLDISKQLHKALDVIPAIPKGRGRIAAAAKLLGEASPTVQLWLTGAKGGAAGLPNIAKLTHIAKVLDVSTDWLLSGEGSMRPAADLGLTIKANTLGTALQFLHEDIPERAFTRLAYDKQGQVLALLYEMIADGRDLDADIKRYLISHINVIT